MSEMPLPGIRRSVICVQGSGSSLAASAVMKGVADQQMVESDRDAGLPVTLNALALEFGTSRARELRPLNVSGIKSKVAPSTELIPKFTTAWIGPPMHGCCLTCVFTPTRVRWKGRYTSTRDGEYAVTNHMQIGAFQMTEAMSCSSKPWRFTQSYQLHLDSHNVVLGAWYLGMPRQSSPQPQSSMWVIMRVCGT